MRTKGEGGEGERRRWLRRKRGKLKKAKYKMKRKTDNWKHLKKG